MNTTANLPLLPATLRFVIAVAVALVLSVAWVAAQHESHDAVLVAGTSLAGRITHVTLPTVEVLGKRLAGKTDV